MAGSSKKVIIAALIGNFLIAATKFVAAFLTRSSAMFSEGIHSVVDTGNQVLLLYGMRRARRPADEDFPFGHGKEIYFWGFVVAILIFGVGATVSVYQGIHHLMHPRHIESFLVNYIVLALAIAFEGAAWTVALIEFRKVKRDRGYFEAVHKGKDPTFFVVLFEDTAAISGLLVALAGIALTQFTGNAVFDGAASVVIGIILAATAFWLAYETKGLLIGESANIHVVQGIREIANANEGITGINDILTMHMGPHYILVNVSVDFDDSMDATAIENTVAELEAMIRERFPRVKRIFIEAEKLRRAITGTAES